MKFDDALEKSRHEVEQRIRNFNALTLAVIRSHLLLEQTIDNFPAAALFHPEYVRKTFEFDQKINLCRSMCFNEDGDQIWKIVKAANELRNKIAHSLDQDQIAAKMKRLREAYLAVLTPEQAKEAEKLPDDRIAQDACVLCAGFLATTAGDAKARREVSRSTGRRGARRTSNEPARKIIRQRAGVGQFGGIRRCIWPLSPISRKP
jgi:hypothetical protein